MLPYCGTLVRQLSFWVEMTFNPFSISELDRNISHPEFVGGKNLTKYDTPHHFHLKKND